MLSDFITNLRKFFGMGTEDKKEFKKNDPIAERRAWDQADFSGFEKDIESGNVKGAKNGHKEFDTVSAMDSYYKRISDDFKDYFYKKYYDPNATDDVPEDIILKESKDFLENFVKKYKLDELYFANGKNFLDNLALYGYSNNLLDEGQRKVETLFPTRRPAYLNKPNDWLDHLPYGKA